ncbi:MAG: ABC transporter substrate-binding protein, partial [Oscillospiraceae bacterium]|nr:ABC transporter substrate-binding protein [Oscillospiraceae bacterium]
MKKILCFSLMIALFFAVGSPVFAADGIEVSDIGYYSRFQGQGITLTVYNWGEYIADGSDGSPDVNKEFEGLTGIKVNYITFATNEQMYAKLKGEGAALYDIIIPSDYMIARMIREDMVEKLDFDNIPNYALVDELYRNLEHDATNEYSVPYMWGLVGLIYNTEMVEEEITSWDALWDERYKGNIIMFDNPRDAFGISLARLGYSMNTDDADELEEAAEELKKQKSLVQAYMMDEIFNKMEGGEAIVAPYYAGDALTMMEENPDLAFVFPDEVTNLFVDSFVIPKGSQNKEAAEMYINFMCEPEISAANAGYIGYSTPISEAFDLLDLDEDEISIAYPDEDIIANSEVFRDLGDETNKLMDRLWTDVRSYNVRGRQWIAPVALL